MECDSSVPSPPSKREDDDEREEDLDKKERRGEDIKKTDDENERMDTEGREINDIKMSANRFAVKKFLRTKLADFSINGKFQKNL